jgi:hypothetical protein
MKRVAYWFVAAGALWWIAVAAFIPADDFFLGETAHAEARSIVESAGQFRAFHVVATLGVMAGVLGVLQLARSVRSRVLGVAAGLACVGAAAWIAEACLRMTVAVSRARDVVAGTQIPGDEPAVASAVLFGVSMICIVAFAVCAWVLARRREPSRRSSLVTALVLTLATLASLATLAPSVVYQFGLLPLGMVGAIATRRRAVEPVAV